MADPKSWNPWHGCRRYSEGCKFCYMFVLDKAHRVPELSTEIVRTKMFNKPLEMTRKGWYKIPSGYTLRVNMTSDTFLEEADEWRKEMWSIIRQRPDVIFYILTKRVPRIMECLPEDWGEGYENVDLNMTCETQWAFEAITGQKPAIPGAVHTALYDNRVDVIPYDKMEEFFGQYLN